MKTLEWLLPKGLEIELWRSCTIYAWEVFIFGKKQIPVLIGILKDTGLFPLKYPTPTNNHIFEGKYYFFFHWNIIVTDTHTIHIKLNVWDGNAAVTSATERGKVKEII